MEWHFVYTYLIGILTVVYLFFRYRFAYWKNRGVPHFPPTIPYGNLRLVGKGKHTIDMLHEIYHSFKGKERFAGAYFTISPVVVATDLDLIRDIMIKDFNYFHDRPTISNEEAEPIAGHLFSIHGEKWRKLRNILSPTFTSGKMKFMFPIVLDVTDRLLNHINTEIVKDDVFEMKELLARYTTDIIGTCAFGIECNSLKDPNAEFRNQGRKVLSETRHSRLTMQLMQQFPAVAKMLRMKIFLEETSSFFNKVVRETVEYREKNNIRRNDFMDMLVQLKNNASVEDGRKVEILTMNEITAQSFIFFLAGFETSATTMSYALYELSKNPEIQETARKEIESVLEKHNGQFTYEAMMEMKYIGQIIMETLRKYPPVPILIRKAGKDYPVADTKHIIEKGQSVFIPIYNIQHDPAIYPNPEVFDPNRFSPEEEKKRHPMSFLGFGDGPRNCIGLRFGKMQTRIGLMTILKNFYIKPSRRTLDPIIFENDKSILTTKGGLYFQLEKI